VAGRKKGRDRGSRCGKRSTSAASSTLALAPALDLASRVVLLRRFTGQRENPWLLSTQVELHNPFKLAQAGEL
jgi:hypothetical protein